MRSSRGSLFLAFLTGVVAGGIIGVLYAPDKGKNTRDKLAFQLDKYKQMLQETIEGLISGKTQPITEAKVEGKKVVSDTIKQAEGLMSEIDLLISKITPKKS
jgi:gas vesicle protein